MKLWHVHRDGFSFDEYDAFVIRAETAEDALVVAIAKEPSTMGQGRNAHTHWTVDEVSVEGASEIILGSFNSA